MDMLYARYSNPMELMGMYINQGRFGDFVSGFLRSETERKNKEVERDNEMKLWIAYIHSHSDKPYGEWKDGIAKPRAVGGDDNLDDAGIMSIMTDLFPGRPLLKER